MTKRRRIPPPKERQAEADYRQLWRLVDGALADVIHHHPEYFRSHDLRAVRSSIAKRVVGAIKGYAGQTAWGRSGASTPAADKSGGVLKRAPVRGHHEAAVVAVVSCGDRLHQGRHFDAETARAGEFVPSQFSLHDVVAA
jgi:hypothetical protein